jgi:DNA-binding NarL/FixJ family response regulator
MTRIIVADDHGLYRKGLRSTLEAALADVEILEANSLDAALLAMEVEGHFDIVLVDLNMRGIVSYNSLAEACACYPTTRFMVISASNAKEDVLACLAKGVHGFVSKLQPDVEIINAVKQVLSGAVYAPPWLAHPRCQVDERFRGGPCQKVHADPLAHLTPRQRDVLPLLARGMSNKEIARALKIAEATTKIHAAALCRLLGARNRTEAAVVASKLLQLNGTRGSVNQRA